MDLSLSQGQKKLIGITLSSICASFLLLLIYGLFLLVHRFFLTFSMVLWPVVISLILSLILKPLVEKVETKLHLKRTSSIVLLFVLVSFIMIAGSAFIVPVILEQVIQFMKNIPAVVKNGIGSVREFAPALSTFIEPYIQSIDWTTLTHPTFAMTKGAVINSVPFFQRAGASIIQLFSVLSMFAIIPIYLFYFLETKRDLIQNLKQYVPFGSENAREDLVFLVQEFLRLLVVFFRGQLVIGAIMGGLLATGFTLIGLEFGFILGLIIGFLNIIPYLGTIIGLSVALPIAYFQPEGGLHMLGLSLLVFGIVQIIEGYLLTPKIMGKQTGLHPFILIFAILFWGTALEGIIGMIVAIPLTAFLITAWALIEKKYLLQISIFR